MGWMRKKKTFLLSPVRTPRPRRLEHLSAMLGRRSPFDESLTPHDSSGVLGKYNWSSDPWKVFWVHLEHVCQQEKCAHILARERQFQEREECPTHLWFHCNQITCHLLLGFHSRTVQATGGKAEEEEKSHESSCSQPPHSLSWSASPSAWRSLQDKQNKRAMWAERKSWELSSTRIQSKRPTAIVAGKEETPSIQRAECEKPLSFLCSLTHQVQKCPIPNSKILGSLARATHVSTSHNHCGTSQV